MTFFSLVADFVGLDPRIAAWLIDPSEAAPSFEDLVAKYLGNSVTAEASSAHGNASGDTAVSCSGFGLSASARPSRSPDTVRSAERLAAQGALWAFALLLQCKCFTFHPDISGRMWVRVGFSVFCSLEKLFPRNSIHRPALQNGPGAATRLFLEWRAACS